MPRPLCPVCGYANPPGAAVCEACGEPRPISERLAAGDAPDELFEDDPDFDPAEDEGDATGGVIPYKNPPALIAYYLGLFSGFPLIGLPLGIAAFVLGIMGLKRRRENPKVKGSAHAWIGIGCGGFFALLWGAVVVMIVVSLAVG
ncbi:zinc finger Ran-binding domain-containing protein [Alienimonas californiensis]|uniref:RanBP2-type domain-containing protein n=1 Tax=Alienimonas californiensis TaxID=2527989 RepID=A0A517P5J1_9PLAN|nr:zinc finger Ran-binding domain-containing protein [Alienimonas californiensis]QDT14647.1 hypothetical protein CA12_07240 [Alienimonas californiensis]